MDRVGGFLMVSTRLNQLMKRSRTAILEVLRYHFFKKPEI
jgi:hypothetical protein